MAKNFPDSPTAGDVFENYTFDGSAWRHTDVFPDSLPAGTIVQWATNTAPANWLICDGSAVSRTEYAALFSVIGVMYGAGNGSTTFNLPNLSGRVPVGKDISQTEFDALGETGGAKTHTLTIGQVPNVTGGFTFHGSEGGGPAWNAYGAFGGSPVNGSYYRTPGGSTYGASSIYAVSFNNGGGGQSHNILQPYVVVNYIIKTSLGTTPDMSQAAVDASNALATASSYETRVAALELPGTVVNSNYMRTNTITSYGLNQTPAIISALNVTITPRYANSRLVVQWMVTYESDYNAVWRVYRDGAQVGTSGSEGFNPTVSGYWNGYAAVAYDGDRASTPNTHMIQYSVPAGSTNPTTLQLACMVSASSGTGAFALNRAWNGTSDAYEAGTSNAMIWEIKQ